MAITNIFGGATADLFGYTAHFVSSSGTDTWANATTASTPCSWATMLTNVAAGEVALIMDDGTYTLTATSAPTNAGSTSAYIAIVGTGNQNGADSNGGRPIIEWPVTGSGIVCGPPDIVWFENLHLKDGQGDGLTFRQKSIAYNVISSGHAGAGFKTLGNNASLHYCDADNNSTYGYNCLNARFHACISRNNTNDGFKSSGDSDTFVQCISHDNGNAGFSLHAHDAQVWNCTAFRNTDQGLQLVGTAAGSSAVGFLRTGHNGTGDKGLDIASPKLFLDVNGHEYDNTSADAANILQADLTSGDPSYTSTTAGSEDFILTSSSAADNLARGGPFVTDPQMDKGALQTADPAGGGGGGMIINPGMDGGVGG